MTRKLTQMQMFPLHYLLPSSNKPLQLELHLPLNPLPGVEVVVVVLSPSPI